MFSHLTQALIDRRFWPHCYVVNISFVKMTLQQIPGVSSEFEC